MAEDKNCNDNITGGFTYETESCFLRIKLNGEIDHHTAVNIRDGADRLILEKRPKRLLIDLSEVALMDSSGLGLIMGRYSLMKEIGGDVVIVNPNNCSERIIRLAGLERIVKLVYENENESRGKTHRVKRMKKGAK